MHLGDQKLGSICLVLEPFFVRRQDVQEFDEVLESPLVYARHLEYGVDISEACNIGSGNDILVVCVVDRHDDLLLIFKDLELLDFVLLLQNLGSGTLVNLSHYNDDRHLEMLRNVELVDCSLRYLGLTRVNHHHDVIWAVTANTPYHALCILLIAWDINEGENLFGLLQNLALAQELEIVDVCNFALVIEAEDTMIDGGCITVQDSMLVSLYSDAGTTLSVVTLTRDQHSKQGALACTLRANEQDLDIELDVIGTELMLP